MDELPSATAIFLPRSWATEWTEEPLGTSRAVPFGLPTVAATTAIFSPPAAAKMGGASPTAPMSTDPAPMAWSIGGPGGEVRPVHLERQLADQPGGGQQCLRAQPAWSPTFSVTLDRLAVLADEVPEALADAEPDPPEPPAAWC